MKDLDLIFRQCVNVFGNQYTQRECFKKILEQCSFLFKGFQQDKGYNCLTIQHYFLEYERIS